MLQKIANSFIPSNKLFTVLTQINRNSEKSIHETFHRSSFESHHRNVYEELYAIAAPSFLDTLRPMLHKGVEDKIVTSINKNITDLNIDELQQRLLQHIDS